MYIRTPLIIQLREGLFSEEEMKLLENGYSVSESDESDGSSIHSLHSHLPGSMQSPELYNLSRPTKYRVHNEGQ